MQLPRRSILTAGAAALGAPLFDVARASCPSARGADSRFWFPLGIQSYSLRHFDLQGAIERTQSLGLHYIEFYPGPQLPPDSDAEALAEIKKEVRRHDLELSAFGVVGFSADEKANRKTFELANTLNIRNLSADPSPDSFASLDALVAEFGIRIAIHNHGPGHRYAKIADVAKAVKGHHPWIGACVDTGHFIRSGEDPVQALLDLGPRVFGVHLKDFAEQKAQTKGVLLGAAHLDVRGVFRALDTIDFPVDGAISLEYEERPEDPMADLEQCVAIATEAARAVAAGD